MSKKVQEMSYIDSILCTALLFELCNFVLPWPTSPLKGDCFLLCGPSYQSPIFSEIIISSQRQSDKIAQPRKEAETSQDQVPWESILRGCPAFHCRGPSNLYGSFEHFMVSFKKCFYRFDCITATLYFGQRTKLIGKENDL